MPKYFLDKDIFLDEDKIYVKKGVAHHLLHVLRYKLGQAAVFCDGKGTDFHCAYESNDTKNKVLLFSIQNKSNNFFELPYKVTLYQSVIASEKMGLAIQKCVELGVNKIVPVLTINSSVKFSGLGIKNDRFLKIAKNAAEQSMRGYVPEISSPVKFENLLASVKKEHFWLVAYEKEVTTSIRKGLNNYLNLICNSNSKYLYKDIFNYMNILNIGIWIGPEGGFSESEIRLLQAAGAITIMLGRRILRAETAGPAALVQLQCALQAEAF